MNIAGELIKRAQLISPFDQEERHESASSFSMTIAKYLKDNPEPDAQEFSEWIMSKGIDPKHSLDALLVLATRFARMALGGKSEGLPPKGMLTDEFKKGVEVEMEHTPDKLVASKIAIDHLTEFPEYYTALAKMESDLKTGGAQSFMERIKSAAAPDIVPRRPMGKKKIFGRREALAAPLRSEQLPESRASHDQGGHDLGAQ